MLESDKNAPLRSVLDRVVDQIGKDLRDLPFVEPGEIRTAVIVFEREAETGGRRRCSHLLDNSCHDRSPIRNSEDIVHPTELDPRDVEIILDYGGEGSTTLGDMINGRFSRGRERAIGAIA